MLQGATCSDPCLTGTYGLRCAHTCQCASGGHCDHVTGSCTCYPGYTGRLYLRQLDISIGCSTNNNAFMSNRCENICPSWLYGQDCDETCDCVQSQTKSCDNVDGQCYCAAGITGAKCNTSYPAGRHGEDCLKNCSCQNGGTCNRFTGNCL